MGTMRDFEAKAVSHISAQAKTHESEKLSLIKRICGNLPCDADILVAKLLSSPITMNFHPDRFSNNGKTIIENLIGDGVYLGQFKTGTTNGGRTAYIGGERFIWEQRLFSGIYPEKTTDRPKYGALNIFEYLDGASARFGSCFFTVKPGILPQCTFAYGDSSSNPEILCTADSLYGILSSLLLDVERNGRLLNRENYSVAQAIDRFMSIGCGNPEVLGKNLDYSIETHIHGDILLKDDIESLHMDESFQGTEFQHYAETLAEKYNIKLKWIPRRQIAVDSINDEFRGPMIKPLAEKIDRLFGHSSGVINASLIGEASRASMLRPSDWEDIGDRDQVFQYLKQLWHTVAFYG